MKSGKACGIDNVRNEFLKNCSQDMVLFITDLFNFVLNSGIILLDWCIGLIIPIYKKKECENNPDNYRGITLLSCVGKLFTAALNCRITKFLELTGSLGDEQAGFREGFSTMDYVFVLHSIINIYLSKKKRLYCSFIDYKKAFDLVDRASLWKKLLGNGINGKILTVIINLYEKAKSCVLLHDQKSSLFSCNIGVRQGENLSPILFAIYLNDVGYFIGRNYKGLDSLSVECSNNLSNEDVEVYFRLYVLLYADDTIVLGESKEELQDALTVSL